jgi:hypothetical protein
MQLSQANSEMARTVRELEAAPAQRASSEPAEGGPENGAVPPEPEQRRSWLYRFFFGA